MTKKRPYTHILKNLLHEQAIEIIPYVLPGYEVKRAFDVEMPDLISTPNEEPPDELDQGLVSLALPGAKVIGSYHTEWIEHSGKFERVYHVKNTETDKPTYLALEFETERNDANLSRDLLLTFVRLCSYAREDIEQEPKVIEADAEKDTRMEQGYYAYPIILCRFPSAVPAHIREETLTFNFRTTKLWEKDAREALNTHVSALYFLLPGMKNADAPLLGLAIEELAQRFQSDEKELGRHLTGLSLMLQQSELLSEEEKLKAQEHLKPFAHLIKADPSDE